MGGTTFKVGVVREGRIDYQRESMVLRYHYALPKLDVVSLGLAGGSIVSVDARIGRAPARPAQRRLVPGPGAVRPRWRPSRRSPTSTRSSATSTGDFFLGGRAPLDLDAARAVPSRSRSPGRSGSRSRRQRRGSTGFANERFTDLLHKATVQRGLDPRRFALFSFGGTAGMHAARVRRGARRRADRRPALGLGARRVRARHLGRRRTRHQTTQPLRVPSTPRS